MEGIGKKIRELRKRKKITLVELSKLTGVAQATLSRIETGVMIGTVESHKKIAKALGTTLADLYAGLDERVETIEINTKSKEDITLSDDSLIVEVMVKNPSNKKIMPALYVIKGKSSHLIEGLDSGIDKFYIAIKGNITVEIGDKKFELREKDSIYFDASLQHKLINNSDKNAEILAITSPPAV